MSKTQKKVIKRLEQIDRITLRLSQYTTDIVAECLEIANNVNDYMPRFEETLGSKCYQIDTVLDIIDPKFESDTTILKEIVGLLNEWQKNIEKTRKI